MAHKEHAENKEKCYKQKRCAETKKTDALHTKKEPLQMKNKRCKQKENR